MREQKAKRLDMTSDLVFRTVYGRDTKESKEALIAVLNLILDRKEDPIVDLVYKNPFYLSEYTAGKQTVMDIKVETSLGEQINLEMQVENLSEYVNRTILYTAQISAEGLERGQEYGKLKKTIHISIVKGDLRAGSEKYHSIYRYMELEEKTELTDVVEIHYLKLDELPKKSVREMTPIEQLGFYLIYAGDVSRQEEIEELLLEGEEGIVLTDQILRKVSAEEILREKEMARKRALYAQAAQEREWKENGLREGREEGLKEGRKEGREEGLRDGLQQGKDDILQLISKMMESGRAADISRLPTDPAFLEEMLKQYDLA